MKTATSKYKIVSRVLTLLGLILFIYVLFRIDLNELWQAIKGLLWFNLIILVGIRFGYWLIRTFNWQIILKRFNCRLSFFSLLKIRLASNTVNYLLPSANIGGEFLRVVAFPKMDRKIMFASVVIDKSCEFLATFLLVFLSFLWVVLPGSQSHDRKILIIVLAFLPLAGTWWMIRIQQRGLFRSLENGLRRLRIRPKYFEKNRQKLEETDQLIREFYRLHRHGLAMVFALSIIQLIVWAVELYLIFWFIGARTISVASCLLILNLGAAIVLLPTTPGSLGLFEFSNISLFALLKVPMHFGMASILVRRVLGYFFAGLGLFPMWNLPMYRQKGTKMASSFRIDNQENTNENSRPDMQNEIKPKTHK